jgi:hypothetical protein
MTKILLEGIVFVYLSNRANKNGEEKKSTIALYGKLKRLITDSV